jgi:hypothetical protein
MGLVAIGNAQVAKDRPNIEKLCGCYNVEFKYAETFSPDPKYKYHDRDEISGGTELILPVEITDRKIVLQHLLVISDSMIIKHWREDWTYEDPTIWKFQGDNTWTKTQVKPEQVKGKWVQSVWEVSDAPRYQGASEWITTDGRTSWENTSYAPLPRREYSTRSDYNILKRTNRIVLTDNGWIHDQNNRKIVRADGKDRLLVEEKGINSYERTDTSQCAAAKKYWEKNKDYWTRVRTVWGNYMAMHSSVTLKKEVNGKALHDYLFELAKDYAQGKVTAANIDNGIKNYLDQFLVSSKDVAHQ